MTRAETIDLLAALSAAFPTYPIEQPTVELYIAGLRDIDAEQARVAVVRWIAEQERYPTLAQLLKACRAVSGYYQPFPALDATPRVAPEAFKSGLEAARASLRGRRAE